MKTHNKFRWIDLIFGIATLLLSLYTLINPLSAIREIVLIIGFVALIGGVSNILAAIQTPLEFSSVRIISIVASGINILVALLILFNVGAGAYLFSLLLPIWFIMHCISRLANMEFLRVYGRKSLYWSTLLLNILGIVFAIMLLFNPVASILFIEFLTGIYLLLIGISSIVTAFSGSIAKSRSK